MATYTIDQIIDATGFPRSSDMATLRDVLSTTLGEMVTIDEQSPNMAEWSGLPLPAFMTKGRDGQHKNPFFLGDMGAIFDNEVSQRRDAMLLEMAIKNPSPAVEPVAFDKTQDVGQVLSEQPMDLATLAQKYPNDPYVFLSEADEEKLMQNAERPSLVFLGYSKATVGPDGVYVEPKPLYGYATRLSQLTREGRQLLEADPKKYVISLPEGLTKDSPEQQAQKAKEQMMARASREKEREKESAYFAHGSTSSNSISGIANGSYVQAQDAIGREKTQEQNLVPNFPEKKKFIFVDDDELEEKNVKKTVMARGMALGYLSSIKEYGSAAKEILVGPVKMLRNSLKGLDSAKQMVVMSKYKEAMMELGGAVKGLSVGALGTYRNSRVVAMSGYLLAAGGLAIWQHVTKQPLDMATAHQHLTSVFSQFSGIGHSLDMFASNVGKSFENFFHSIGNVVAGKEPVPVAQQNHAHQIEQALIPAPAQAMTVEHTAQAPVTPPVVHHEQTVHHEAPVHHEAKVHHEVPVHHVEQTAIEHHKADPVVPHPHHEESRADVMQGNVGAVGSFGFANDIDQDNVQHAQAYIEQHPELFGKDKVVEAGERGAGTVLYSNDEIALVKDNDKVVIVPVPGQVEAGEKVAYMHYGNDYQVTHGSQVHVPTQQDYQHYVDMKDKGDSFGEKLADGTSLDSGTAKQIGDFIAMKAPAADLTIYQPSGHDDVIKGTVLISTNGATVVQESPDKVVVIPNMGDIPPSSAKHDIQITMNSNGTVKDFHLGDIQQAKNGQVRESGIERD